jgi:hyperosmotically inducible protein
VNTPEERARAVEIAQRTSGVQSVVSNLTLADQEATATSGLVAEVPRPADEVGSAGQTPEAPLSDGAIVALIRSGFAGDSGLSILDIDVQVEQGIVRLSGDVPDLATRVRAERLARAVRGVTEVRNDLVIKR